MSTALSLLTSNVSSTTLTSYSTAAVNPAAGSRIYLVFAMRSTDLASVSAEVETVSGCASTWTQRQRRNYDSSDRMFACLYEGFGAFTNQAITLGTVSNLSLIHI